MSDIICQDVMSNLIVPKAGPRTWTKDTQTQIAIVVFTVAIYTITAMFLLTLRRFNSNPRDFSVDLVRQSNGSKLADDGDIRRDLRRPFREAAEDSGIDSDDSVSRRLRAQGGIQMLHLNQIWSSDEEPVLSTPPLKRPHWDLMYNESGSSDDEMVLRSPRPKWAKSEHDEQMEHNMEEEWNDREYFIPMLGQHRPRLDDNVGVMPASPARSSSPLYEVELTASDEEEDDSVLELVIPLQSARRKKVSNSARSNANVVTNFFCSIFCCFRTCLQPYE